MSKSTEIFNIFNYSDYKQAVKAWIARQPKGGRGQFRKLALQARVSTVFISQVFNGDRHLSMDHGFEVSKFLELGELETRYFLLMIEEARAGSNSLKAFTRRQLESLRNEAANLKQVLKQERELTDAEKAIFHSNWTYSGVRLITATAGRNSSQAIAKALSIPGDQVLRVLEFLETHGLVIRDPGGFAMGPQRTHLEKSSPYILARQKTWRAKAFECMDRQNENDLYYTGPMSTSVALAKQFRRELTEFLKSLSERVVSEKPEELFCLNIDLFQISK